MIRAGLGTGSEPAAADDALTAADRFERWHESLRAKVPLEVGGDRPADFRGHEHQLTLGSAHVRLKDLTGPLELRRRTRQAREVPEVYHLMVPLKGALLSEWGGRSCETGVGDVYVQDLTRFERYGFRPAHGQTSFRTMTVVLPKAALPLSGRAVNRLLGQPMPATRGVGSLLRGFLTQLTADAATFRPADGPRLETVLCDLVSAVFAHRLDAEEGWEPTSRQRVLVTNVQSFVQQHLHDAELTPRTVAAAHHISV
ncbi:AraC family transcriptional regulator, partial [Streptomyces sp. B1866]|uniref:AraC-like ligand-binding domain-containing protein n=1 Tax=Streptomyces sp. B1866 TaxID=3075431 RepID=UPI0028905B49